jgi:tetratricopeptide (TPR) repeat protein
MYRRSISQKLFYVACALGLFIVYHAWLKPTYIPSPPPPQSEQLVPIQPETVPEPSHESPVPEPKQTRIIEQTAVPDTKDHDLLEAIRDEIEKGNVKEAEIKLGDLPSSLVSSAKTRPYVAVLWNNLGIEQEKSGGTASSVKAFKKAASLDAKNPAIQLNLAHAYWELRDPAMTPEFLEQLIALAPNEPFPHLALADLLQERNRLEEAARHLDQAADRAGKDPGVQSYLRAVTAKVRQTGKLEQRLNSRDSTHFTVKYDGDADQGTWTAVLEILEDAYREIGQKLGHFPSKPIVVVLHAQETFQTATGSPAWADGLFDSVLGRIQVPTQGALTDQAWLRRVLRHEFVHALLHDQLGLNATAIPTWLNEGLAITLSADRWEELDQLRHQDFRVIPLPMLEGAWGGLSPDAVSVAYLEAHSAVHYMIDRYGMHRVHELLSHLKARQALPTAMQSQLSLSYEQFQARWMEQLHAQVKKS